MEYTKNTPYVIGLTGGIGSGKTTIANLFGELGVSIIDADIVAREAVAPGTKGLLAIKQRFGNSVINHVDNTLDRAALREIIFSNEHEKAWLNQLLHPLIRESIFDQIEKVTTPYCLLVAPLLFENNLHQQVDRTLCIDVTEATQVNRTKQRDGSSEQIIKNIIASQISRKERVSLSEDIIRNDNKTIDELRAEVVNFDKKYTQLALKKVSL